MDPQTAMSEPTVKNSNALISVAAVIVIVYGMQAAKVLIVPFLLAIFIALMTVRPMLWLQSHRVPSVIAALLIVLILMLGLTGVGLIVGSSIAEFTAALPGYQARLGTIVQGALEIAASYMDDGTDAGTTITGLTDLLNPGWAMGLAAGLLNALRDVLTNTFLILFTMVFILLEASSIGTKVQAAFGRRGRSLHQARKFLNDLGRYLGIKTAVSMVTGLLAGILTWAIGLDFPLLWGMLAFVLNYIPTIGSIIAAIPPILMAIMQFGPAEASTTAIGFLAINVVFGNILEPRIMGYGVGISPLVVFIGLVFWGWVFGPVGMLLAVPLTMTLKLGLESDERSRWIAVLIGSERDAEHALQKQADRTTG
jgi:predicted PurR-regulated permease PerM